MRKRERGSEREWKNDSNFEFNARKYFRMNKFKKWIPTLLETWRSKFTFSTILMKMTRMFWFVGHFHCFIKKATFFDENKIIDPETHLNNIQNMVAHALSSIKSKITRWNKQIHYGNLTNAVLLQKYALLIDVRLYSKIIRNIKSKTNWFALLKELKT